MITRAWAIRTGGWAGTVTLDDGSPTVISPPAFGSSLSQALYLRDNGPGYFSVALSSSGRWQFTGSSAFTMAESGNVLDRLGFAAAPYSSATSHTAAAVGLATSAPYAIDVVTLDRRPASSPARGVPLYASTVRRTRGRGEWRSPVVATQVPMADWLQALEDWNAYLQAPAEVDVLYDDAGTLTLATLAADGLRVRVLDTRTGWASLELACTEAVA